MPPATTLTARDLLRHSVEAVLDAVASGRPFAYGPLVVVLPHGAGFLADLAQIARATVFVGTGADLGRELEAAAASDRWPRLKRRLTRAGLAIVRDLESIGSRPRQELFGHLLDASGGTGTVWCCSLASHPVAARLEPGLTSRLIAGLVVCGGDLPPAALAPRLCPGPCPADVLAATARHYGFTRRALVGSSRARSLAWARSLAMYLARHLGGSSYAVIGRTFGGRDHTTALHGVRAAAARLAEDARLADDAARITAALLRPEDVGAAVVAGTRAEREINAVGWMSDRGHRNHRDSVRPESTRRPARTRPADHP